MESRDFKQVHGLLDILHSANLGLVVIDRDLVVCLFNRFMQVHSDIPEGEALGQSLLMLFPELPDQWLRRRVRSVFELAAPVYASWEERPYLFRFELRLPLHPERNLMYQNIMLIPLHGLNTQIDRVGIVVYDVTDSAMARRELEATQLQLLELSRTDRLTGLYGRGYWEERLQQEWSRMQRSAGPASLVMFDIDHFKRVNDVYGHPTGDEAIRRVARTLRETAREIDVCGRYGGEEFAVILPNTNAAGAVIFCERFRRRLEKTEIPARGASIHISVSLGVAALTMAIGSPTAWIECADRALYRAKAGGRNQTCVYAQGDT